MEWERSVFGLGGTPRCGNRGELKVSLPSDPGTLGVQGLGLGVGAAVSVPWGEERRRRGMAAGGSWGPSAQARLHLGRSRVEAIGAQAKVP